MKEIVRFVCCILLFAAAGCSHAPVPVSVVAAPLPQYDGGYVAFLSEAMADRLGQSAVSRRLGEPAAIFHTLDGRELWRYASPRVEIYFIDGRVSGWSDREFTP